MPLGMIPGFLQTFHPETGTMIGSSQQVQCMLSGLILYFTMMLGYMLEKSHLATLAYSPGLG